MFRSQSRISAFVFDNSKKAPVGVSAKGIDESFSTQAPISLYGATKLASEVLALEYAETYKLPVFVNRAGVLAGARAIRQARSRIFLVLDQFLPAKAAIKIHRLRRHRLPIARRHASQRSGNTGAAPDEPD